MGGSSKKVTVGYKYYLGMHMILCHGPIDRIKWFKVDDRIAWQGNNRGGSVTVSAEGLFGGESREGGVSGQVDIEMGKPTQGRNSYLLSKVSADVPAYRGVVGAVLRHCYLGINPYLKKWAFRGQRIHVRQDGQAQWYDTKAEIGGDLVGITGRWQYQYAANALPVPAIPSGGWSGPSRAPFGRIGPSSSFSPEYPINTSWPHDTGLWLKTTVKCNGLLPVSIYGQVENAAFVFWDGQLIGSVNPSNVNAATPIYMDFVVPTSKATAGDHTIHIFALDDFEPYGNSDSTYIWCQVDQHADMNPAHIIRECLTDPDWGMGYAEADIDDDSFRAAADVLWDEKMGISLLWDRQVPIESFIQEVVKHIDAALYVSRSTGKFVLKLIRADYDEETLPEFDPSNVEKVDNPSRPAFGELTNSVSVNYWNAATGKEASLTVQDTAMIQMQGAVINTTVQYPGFSNFTIASRVALRDLRTLSSPLLTCTIYTNQDARELNIGDAFKFSWPDFEIENVVMRVTGIAFGDGKSNKIRVTCTQDVFAFPQQGVLNQPEEGWTDIGGPPAPATNRLVLEAPYYELVQAQGQTAVDGALASTPEIGYLTVAAARPANALNASVWVNPGSGFEETMALDFCPSATLAADIGPMDTSWTFENGEDLDLVQVGTHCQIDGELVRVDSIDLGTSTITVGRGVLDTTPRPHLTGARLYFWDVYSSADPTEYVDGETLEVKITPATNEGPLDLSEAPTDTLTLDARAARPYPPGKLQTNGAYFPETIFGTDLFSFTWAHRDRRQQTGADYVGFLENSIGPEVGTTYEFDFYNENGVLSKQLTAIGGTSAAWNTEADDSLIIAVQTKQGWRLDLAAYSGKSLNVNSSGIPVTSASIQGGFFKDDGTKLYVLVQITSTTSRIVQYTLSTPWDISTATYDSKNFNPTAQVQGGNGFFIRPDGLKLYVLNSSPSTYLYQYTLSTPWDISTATYDSVRFSTADDNPQMVYFNPSGLKFFITGHTNGRIYEYTLSTPWDISTATLIGSISMTQPTGIVFRNDGLLFWVMRFDNKIIYEYNCSTAWSLTGASTTGKTYSVSSQESSPQGLLASNDGSYFYVFGNTNYFYLYNSYFETGSYRLNGRVRIVCRSRRDGYSSFQEHDFSVERQGYGFNYGKRYGN